VRTIGIVLYPRFTALDAVGVIAGIEYDPQPPFDAGSPDKAPPKLVEVMRANARRFLEE
jgi:hypothetical protein